MRSVVDLHLSRRAGEKQGERLNTEKDVWLVGDKCTVADLSWFIWEQIIDFLFTRVGHSVKKVCNEKQQDEEMTGLLSHYPIAGCWLLTNGAGQVSALRGLVQEDRRATQRAACDPAEERGAGEIAAPPSNGRYGECGKDRELG